jgi:hypothetical protein
VKELYKNILNGKSIQESFNKNKGNFKEKNIVDIFPPSKKKKDYIISPEEIDRFKSNKNDIKLNKNCSLNLDFVKYNYRRIIGRNVELKNCIDKLVVHCNVCVCGYPGAGKKSFIQAVGKFVFEHNMFQEVKYTEIYYLRNAEEILKNKVEEIKSDLNMNDDNQLENDLTKILLIINTDFIITDENDVFILEDLINRIKDKKFSYLFAFTINKKFNFAQIKNKLQRRTPMIELDKLQQDKRLNLFYSINTKKKDHLKKQEEIIKKTNGFPNEIYLRTLFIKCFFDEIKNIDVDKITNEFIFKKIFQKYKVNKIFSIFTNKIGIREDVLQVFFEKDEISLIKNELNFIIFCEKDEKGKSYSLDNSFKDLIKELLNKEYEKGSNNL